MTPKIPSPPSHLSAPSKKLWTDILEQVDIVEQAQFSILAMGLEAVDRKNEARRRLDDEGLTFLDRLEQIKPSPLCNIERDARAAAMAAFKMLGLHMPLDGS